MVNSVDTDQTAPIGAVCSGSTLFASILNSSVLLGKYLQQTTSADNIIQMHFFLGALSVNPFPAFHNICRLLSLICLCTLVAYITNSMDPDQTAPLGAV